ncbi:plasmid replication, integration and excision activator [Streptosporangium sp. NPDC048865]|uniref:plasmid replication, integration and excision activator n=1 Tax=Streptosporangium sp. NPDC048865 TaxID=3155766 RepID=UPI003436E94C
MALQDPIPVTYTVVFPHGCYIADEVEPVKDFDASSNGRFVQARDKQTAELVWQVAVVDGDPTLKPAQKTVAVKILAPVQPVPPRPMPGLPFTPVEFNGITITPYVNAASPGRPAYSIKIREMYAPRQTAQPAQHKASAGRDAA